MVATFDSLMIMFVVHTIVFVDYFKMDLDELKKLYEDEKSDKKETKKKLRDIFQSHKTILEYFLL